MDPSELIVHRTVCDLMDEKAFHGEIQTVACVLVEPSAATAELRLLCAGVFPAAEEYADELWLHAGELATPVVLNLSVITVLLDDHEGVKLLKTNDV